MMSSFYGAYSWCVNNPRWAERFATREEAEAYVKSQIGWGPRLQDERGMGYNAWTPEVQIVEADLPPEFRFNFTTKLPEKIT